LADFINLKEIPARFVRHIDRLLRRIAMTLPLAAQYFSMKLTREKGALVIKRLTNASISIGCVLKQ
jgi:hypothetical protein